MLKPGGQAFLDGLLQQALSARVQQRLELAPRFLGAVDALEAAACLTGGDAVEWRDRWFAAIKSGANPQAPRAALRADLSALADESDNVIHGAPVFTGAQLLRVVAASAREFSAIPSPLGAELYEDGVVVRWVEATPERGGMPEHPVRVTDDLGTRFRMSVGGGRRIGLHVHHEVGLVPAVPQEASVLYVELASGARLSLALH